MKLLLLFLFLFSFSSFSFGEEILTINPDITFHSQFSQRFYLHEGDQKLNAFSIKVPENPSHQFAIKIPEDFPSIFTNISSGYVNNTPVDFTYSKDRKILYFETEETEFELYNVSIRIYGERHYGDSLLLDLGNTGEYEAKDFYSLSIRDEESRNKRDILKPEPLENLTSEITENGILFSWDTPVDLDVYQILIQKTSSGFYKEYFIPRNEKEFLDTETEEGKSYNYAFHARDQYFLSNAQEISFPNFSFPKEEETIETPEEENEETPLEENLPQEEEKTTEDSFLFPSYSGENWKQEIFDTAVHIVELENPEDRISLVREAFTKIPLAKRPWLMRFVIQEILR
jgi:hypothetical protein